MILIISWYFNDAINTYKYKPNVLSKDSAPRIKLASMLNYTTKDYYSNSGHIHKVNMVLIKITIKLSL
jgi:hypothetical protein